MSDFEKRYIEYEEARAAAVAARANLDEARARLDGGDSPPDADYIGEWRREDLRAWARREALEAREREMKDILLAAESAEMDALAEVQMCAKREAFQEAGCGADIDEAIDRAENDGSAALAYFNAGGRE